MRSECRGYTFHITVFCLLLAAVISLAGCSNPEKAKAEHVARGEAYLKESKFQEASLEFRNAIQIDNNLAAAQATLLALVACSFSFGFLKLVSRGEVSR